MSNKELCCYTNIEYLCKKKGISLAELRKKLNVSLLQISDLSRPRISKIVADYFGITQEDFLYADFLLPKRYRNMKKEQALGEICEMLLLDAKENIEDWYIPENAIVKKLYSGEVYKQISVCRKFDEFDFLFIVNVTEDSHDTDKYSILPEKFYSYGYINSGIGYKMFFESFENETFNVVCDEILNRKGLSLERWITQNSYKHEAISFSIDISSMMNDIVDDAMESGLQKIMFGYSEEKSVADRIQLLEQALIQIDKTEIGQPINKELEHFYLYCDVLKDEILDVRVQVVDLLEHLKEKQLREKQKYEEKVQKELAKKRLLDEISRAQSVLGQWNKLKDKHFVQELNELSIEKFCAQLKLISDLSYVDICEILPNISEKKADALKCFLWAKRISCFENFDECNLLVDYQIHMCEYKKQEILALLSFIKKHRKGKLKEYYSGLSTAYAEIVVLIGIFDKNTIKIVGDLRYLHIEAGINNASLDEIYNDINLLYGMNEDVIQEDNTAFFSPEQILELSNAQWTDFYEEFGDAVIEKSINYVWESVSELFLTNGIGLEDFFTGRRITKKYRLFRNQYNKKLDAFAEMLDISKLGIQTSTDIIETSNVNGGIYIYGVFDTIELEDSKGYYYPYPVIDRYLATYICKYMENRLRIITKYKSKVSYKYGGYYCIEAFINNKDVPKKIVSDYRILQNLIETGVLRKAIYQGMDKYFEANPEELYTLQSSIK